MKTNRKTLRMFSAALAAAAVLTLGLWPQGAQAQNADEPVVVELPFDPEVGDRIRLVMAKERVKIQGGERSSPGRSEVLVDLEVLERSEQAYVIRWSYGKTSFSSPQAAPNLLVEKMAGLTEGLQLDLQTDSWGSVLGLRNKADVLSTYQAAVEVMFGALAEAGVSAADIERVEAGLAGAFTPEAIEIMVLREPSLFFAPSGGVFQLATPNDYEDLLPNPLGGAPIPSKAYMMFKEVDADAGLAVIEWKQSIDPVKGRAVLLETLRQIAKRTNSPEPTEADLPTLEIEDLALFTYDTASGWPREVSHRRSITVGDRGQIDSLSFRNVAP